MPQYQQEREEPQRTRPRQRSWGELLAAWLLVVWGGATALFVVRSWWPALAHDEDILRKVGIALGAFQAFFSVCAGFSYFLRYRIAARWCLNATAFCIIGFSALGVFFEWKRLGSVSSLSLFIFAALFILALCLVFLGRWLAQQEDAEA